MEYRNIGNTGMAASIIGLGAEHLDNKPYETVEETIHAALDHQINMIDIFMPGDEVRRNIGKALGNRRKDVIIQGHIGSVDLNEQYDISRDLSTCKRYFEKLLNNLGTDYIDIGMLFFLDSAEAVEQIYSNGIVDYALELKEKGIIRAIGMSSHNPEIARKMLEKGIVDLMMFSINPAFDMTPPEKDVLSTFDEKQFAEQQYATIDPVRAGLYQYCEQKKNSHHRNENIRRWQVIVRRIFSFQKSNDRYTMYTLCTDPSRGSKRHDRMPIGKTDRRSCQLSEYERRATGFHGYYQCVSGEIKRKMRLL